MSKKSDLPAAGDGPYSFYRPHKRVQFGNEMVNPVTGEVTYPPSMTKQSFKEECDINNIIAHYKVSGMITHINGKAAQGAYEDLPPPQEFQEALNTVIAAENAFATLPAKVRARFGNDPEGFLSFMADPANAKEMADLGLARLVVPQKAPQQGQGTTGGEGGTPPSDASPKAPQGASQGS